MRILVYPEQLRRTAQTFRWAAGLWSEQAAYLERALNSLHWEVRQRIQMESQMTHAIRLAWGLAEGARSKAVFLEQAATRFEVADRQGVQGVESMLKDAPFINLPPWLPLLGDSALSLATLFGLGVVFSTPLFIIGHILSHLFGESVLDEDFIPSILEVDRIPDRKDDIQPKIPEVQPRPSPKKRWTREEILRQVAETYGDLPKERGEQCVHWARRAIIKRTQKTGKTYVLPYLGKNGGAAKFINIFRDEAFNVSPGVDDLTKIQGLKPGSLVVWTDSHPRFKGSSGYTYGHVAVVEAVEKDGIWVSQANWRGRQVMYITKDELAKVYHGVKSKIVGEDAKIYVIPPVWETSTRPKVK